MINIQELAAKYPIVASKSDRLCREITRQLDKIVNDEGIELGFPIQFRVKSQESILTKLERITRITDFTEIQDIAGIRVTLIFERDVKRVTEKIIEFLDVIDQYNTIDRLKEDQFGYASIHVIAKLKSE